tara:strand:+ start:1483 stop:2271 length:789 start_codon:yes stop_codon:yes gene_type:complete
MQFNFCNPDANSFNNTILVKSLSNWNVEYVPLTDLTGYWIGDNVFLDDGFDLYKKLIATFPVVKNNNVETCSDPNPFSTIHLPEWMTLKIMLLIKEFYTTNLQAHYINGSFTEWGNLFWKNTCRPVDLFRIPHVDYEHGLVGNMWLNEIPEGLTGTNLYEYSGNTYGIYYDFQIDTAHSLHTEWKNRSTNLRLDGWKNFSDDEAEFWGFKKVGVAPSTYKKITMYKANTPHCPYIDASVDFRWSHTFAFKHDHLPANYIGAI